MSPDWTKRREASVSNPKPTHDVFSQHFSTALPRGGSAQELRL